MGAVLGFVVFWFYGFMVLWWPGSVGGLLGYTLSAFRGIRQIGKIRF